MKKLLLAGAVMAIATAAPAVAQVTVIDFDDLTGFSTVPATYKGVNFGNNFVYYDSPQNPYNAHSGNTRIFGNYDLYGVGADASIPFTFSSNTFLGLWVSGAGVGSVSYDLYNGATLVASSASLVSNGTPTFLASGYSGQVTGVTINAANGYSVYDDLTFGSAIGAVPEPAMWAMMIFGMGTVGVAMRRRKHTVRIAYA